MKPIPHFRTRARLGPRPANLKDPRSYVVASTGRVVLRGRDKTKFRLTIFKRSGGYCEECGRYARWDGLDGGELSHLDHHSVGGLGDVEQNVIWSCKSCHRKRHPGPQWTPKSEVA